ncbi:MAG: nitroreductase family protein [Anaerolineae bacterium]|nr:nitroreductase family protein [Anaerolineae bacterium]
MEFFDLIKTRRSVRAYKPDPVEASQLDQILEAARWAPTAANRQPFRVMVIKTAGREAELGRIYERNWFVEAPLVLCVCGVEAEGWVRRYDGKSYLDVDAAIVMDHIVLAATALGLGTCWIAAFDPEAASEVLALPPDVEPIIFTPLGVPDDRPGIKRRKALEDIVKYDTWS